MRFAAPLRALFGALTAWIEPYLRPRTDFLPYFQLVGTLVALWAAALGSYSWHWWAAAVFVYFLTDCLGVEVTFHRYLTHQAFKMPRPLEVVFSVFGVLGGTGSGIAWAAMHDRHHTFSDLPGDPHSPKSLGWRVLISMYEFDAEGNVPRRLLRDRFQVNLHKYYYLILALWLLALLLISYEAVLFLGVIPIAMQNNVLTLTNYIGHTVGYRNFETSDDSRNNPPLALIGWGLGWHNNHHHNPRNWNFRVRWWELDISALVIAAIKR